jgi:hypothetical protein
MSGNGHGVVRDSRSFTSDVSCGGGMAKNKPSTSSAALLDTRSATELERLSRIVGAPVDERAIDRILAVIELEGKTGILAEGFDPATLDSSATAEIKRHRWAPMSIRCLAFSPQGSASEN